MRISDWSSDVCSSDLGIEGLHRNVALLADMRAKVGDDFWLMYDCWMSLNLDYATRLAIACHDLGLKWIEEALSPDDYWGYADLRRNVPRGMLVTTGEHAATRDRTSTRLTSSHTC